MTASRSLLMVSPYRIEYGPPQTLEHVCKAVDAAGYHPVCVVPPGARITDGLRELDPPIRVLDGLATVPRTLDARRMAGFLAEHVRAARQIEQIGREYDAGGVYSISEAIFAANLAAQRLSVPSIVHVIGMSIASPRWGGNIYVRFLDRITDRFIACSSAVAEMLASYGVEDDRIAVVHNGIAVDEIEATEGEPSPVSYPGPKVGMVAAYDPRKGHELFVATAAEVARSHPDARFYLLGGTLRSQAESPAFEERVRGLIRDLGLESQFERPGYIPAPEVFSWIRAMDVVVVPSRTEAFAHALLEAMACGKAVVATGIEGNLDAFADGHSGLYVEPTPDAVARAVRELLADPDRAAALGAAARERARLFDLGVTLPVIGETVAELMRSRREPMPTAEMP